MAVGCKAAQQQQQKQKKSGGCDVPRGGGVAWWCRFLAGSSSRSSLGGVADGGRRSAATKTTGTSPARHPARPLPLRASRPPGACLRSWRSGGACPPAPGGCGAMSCCGFLRFRAGLRLRAAAVKTGWVCSVVSSRVRNFLPATELRSACRLRLTSRATGPAVRAPSCQRSCSSKAWASVRLSALRMLPIVRCMLTSCE